MKNLQINRAGILILMMASTMPGGGAHGAGDRYAPLRTALAEKNKEAVLEIEDARFLAEEYTRVLDDPEIHYSEKPEIRKLLIAEEIRLKQHQARVARLQLAIRELRAMPRDQDLTADALRKSHEGLSDLGLQGKAAWDLIIAERDAAVESLTEEYRMALANATMAYEGLQTAERANRILNDSLDHHRPETSEEEFEVSRGLPAIKIAVELGFGLTPKSDDPSLHAQTTLLALVGYRQFFRDHGEEPLTPTEQDSLFADKTRNILGVANGDVLASNAVAKSQSNYYYLSQDAKEPFNGRIRAIWGTEGSASVTWWNQHRAPGFHRACAEMSTIEGSEILVPNRNLFALLEEIDALIEEKEQAAQAIEDIHAVYGEQLEAARRFDGREGLSSAHHNALRLAKNAEQTLERFKAADKLLDAQLATCGNDDWIPDADGIVRSARSIGVIQRSHRLAGEVKKELAALLR